MDQLPLDAEPVDVRWFSVADTGRAHGSDTLAAHTGEAMLYVTRIAESMGYRLGAGALQSIEIFGPSSALAELRDADEPGAVIIAGCVTPSRSSSREEFQEWLRAGGWR